MKIFVSADIEGIAGTTAWDEVRKGNATYAEFARQMTAETAAVCTGARQAGASEIVVKDAHGDGRNLIHAGLPRGVTLIRGYNGHPFTMLQGLDATFAAALFVGYHARAGSGGNPLAHTLNGRDLVEIRINDRPVSEFMIQAWTAGSVGVPVCFVAGDAALCDEVASVLPAATTLPVKVGQGASTTSLHPQDAADAIQDAASRAFERRDECVLNPPALVNLEVRMKDQSRAYSRSWYPGAQLIDAHTVAFDTDDWFETLRALLFIVSL